MRVAAETGKRLGEGAGSKRGNTKILMRNLSRTKRRKERCFTSEVNGKPRKLGERKKSRDSVLQKNKGLTVEKADTKLVRLLGRGGAQFACGLR